VSVNDKGPTVGNSVTDNTFSLVGCDIGRTVHLLHVFVQWLFTCLISQILFLFLFVLTHVQLLFLFENFNFGILSDLSLHPGCVKDKCEVGSDEWLTVGCNDGKTVHISHVCWQWLFTSMILQSSSLFILFLSQLQFWIIFSIPPFLFLYKNVGIKPDLSAQLGLVNVDGSVVDDDNDTVDWEEGCNDGSDDGKEVVHVLHVCLQKLFTVSILQYSFMSTCLFIDLHVFFLFVPLKKKLGVRPSLSLHSMFWEGKEVGIGDTNEGLCEACELGSWLESSVGAVVLSIAGIINGFEVGINEYDGISVGLDVNWKEGSIVGSDEGLCDGWIEGKYEDSSVGFIEEYNIGTSDRCEVGIDEWWSLGIDDKISVNNTVGMRDIPREGCNVESIVGSDEGLCDGLIDGMYEGNAVGSSEEYNVGTTDGFEVGIDEWWSLGTDDGISVNNVGAILEVEVGCKEGSIVGSDKELCDGLVDGMYEDCSVGFIEECNVGTTDGYEVGIEEWWPLGLDDGIYVCWEDGAKVGRIELSLVGGEVGLDVGWAHVLHVIGHFFCATFSSQCIRFRAINSQLWILLVLFIQTGLVVSSQGQLLHVKRHLSFTISMSHIPPVFALIFSQLVNPSSGNMKDSIESKHNEGSPHSPQLLAQCCLMFDQLHNAMSSLTYEHGLTCDLILIGPPSSQTGVDGEEDGCDVRE